MWDFVHHSPLCRIDVLLKYRDESSKELHIFMDTLQTEKINHLERVQSCINKVWD